jgi:hypothetical protein
MRIAAITLVVWLAQASYKADLRLPSTQVRTMAAAEAPAAEFVLRDRPLSASDGERPDLASIGTSVTAVRYIRDADQPNRNNRLVAGYALRAARRLKK